MGEGQSTEAAHIWKICRVLNRQTTPEVPGDCRQVSTPKPPYVTGCS